MSLRPRSRTETRLGDRACLSDQALGAPREGLVSYLKWVLRLSPATQAARPGRSRGQNVLGVVPLGKG